PEARILPLDGSPLPVRVVVHAQAAADGQILLELPAGWSSSPAQAEFHLKAAGDSEPLEFRVSTDDAKAGSFTVQAVAQSGGQEYRSGWQSVGYPGLRPYNLYRPAQLKARKVDVRVTPGLRVGYVMGTGDLVPEAIEGLGLKVHPLTAAELTSGELSGYDAIVVGIRAYSARPELARAEPRLDEWVRSGGTLIVQYQSANFPAPLPLSLGRSERVVDEEASVELLAPADPLLSAPNRITRADFDGWVEERGHSFLESWDPGFTALTETADPGQDPQRGGLVVAHPGKGTYVYVAYALYRQLPELVPGAYRLLANLLSASRASGSGASQR
ncbi:MAG: PIG-L family deacetylase, partial [Terracidiphilus sp.]